MSSKIYQPCKEFIFNAKYWVDEKLVSDEQLSIFITGNEWEYSSDQMEALMVYQPRHSEVSIEKIKTYGTNPEINDRDWVKQSTTGIIENERGIFHHPFRDNQYYFTEMAPFPNINYPLHVGKTWSASLSVNSGWGIWSGQTLATNYRVVEKEAILVSDKKYHDCWKIFSSATSDFGISYLTMWFDDQYGFVKLKLRYLR